MNSWACRSALLKEQTFWDDFVRSLTRRGLAGVKLGISDGNRSIGNAVARILPDVAWHVCRTHFQRGLLRRVRRDDRRAVSASLAVVFGQPDRAGASMAFHHFADRL